MAKPGFLKVLAPIAAIGASALLGPEIFGAFGAAEGGLLGGAEGALGAAGEGAFLIPGTETALAAPTLTGVLDTAALGGGLGAGAGALGAGVGEAAASALPAALESAAPLATEAASATGFEAAAAAPLSTTAAGAGEAAAGLPSATAAAPGLGGAAPSGAFGGVVPDLTAAGTDFMGGPDFGIGTQLLGAEAPSQGAATAAPLASGASAAPQPEFLIPGTDTPLPASAGAFDGGTLELGSSAGDKIGAFAGKAGDWAASHPGALLTAGLLAPSLFGGGAQQAYPAEKTIQDQGSQYAKTATALTSPLQSGVLPVGAQQWVDAATNAAEAQTRSTYANLGLSGSTMEADRISQTKANAAAQQFGIAESLLASGAKFGDLSRSAYSDVLKAQVDRDKDYQNALYRFAGALAGSGYNAA